MTLPVLLVGASGTLGASLEAELAARGRECVALDRRALDITDEPAVAEAVRRFAAGTRAGAREGSRRLLVNAAAYTDVEGAESDREAAFLANEHGPRVLARHSRVAGIDFVHVSTDFVFDGELGRPYTEEDAPGPLGVYGASKLAGERAVAVECPEALIVRTAWVYSREAGFPARILRAAGERERLSVVTDERGSPTYAPDLAAGILELHAVGAHGLYHLAGQGSCTRFELAEETLRVAGLRVHLDPATADEFPSAVRRPRDSSLDCGKAAANGVALRPWREALYDAFHCPGPETR